MENESGTTSAEVENNEESVQPETLRDQIESQFDEVEATPVSSEQESSTTVASERVRDEQGRFARKTEDVVPVSEATEPLPEPVTPERLGAPSTWSKEYYDSWDQLDPKVAEYILKRENDFTSGVSAYKQEYDNVASVYEQAKPLVDAMQPFMAELEANNIDPGYWMSSLGNAHKMLSSGSPEQKLSMFLKLAGDYQVPMEQLFAQDKEGKVYFNPQGQPYQATPQPTDINRLVETKVNAMATKQELERFIDDKDGEGHPSYPHFEAVRDTMAQLLEAGLANDLPSAYEESLKHSRHADIYTSIQKEEADRNALQVAQKRREQTLRAKRNNISPRGDTPTGGITNAKKGLRGQLEEAFDTVAEQRL